MRYLYGDSTPSPLQSNYLAFLEDAMEFCIHLLLAQERIAALHRERKATEEYCDSERARIEGLRALVIEASETANTDGETSISYRAVERVKSASEQAITTTLGELAAKLAADRADLAAKEREERDGCLEAFGKWIALHEPHDGTWQLDARLGASGYEGTTSGAAPYGVSWSCAIELADDHPMIHGIRVGDFVTQIELPIPEATGWLKKTKVRPQRIDQYRIDSYSSDGTEDRIELRQLAPATGALDVTIREDKVTIVVPGGREEMTVDASEDDRQRLITLRDRIRAALTTHAGVRRRVVDATMDDAPLADNEDLGAVAKRLIDAAAPIVQQIRAHSQSPNELVIRRLLSNKQRVEIFVSTAQLLEKLGRLPRALRPMMGPLGLEYKRVLTPPPFEALVMPESVVGERPDPKSPKPAPPVEPEPAPARAEPEPAPTREPEPASTRAEPEPNRVDEPHEPARSDERVEPQPASTRGESEPEPPAIELVPKRDEPAPARVKSRDDEEDHVVVDPVPMPARTGTKPLGSSAGSIGEALGSALDEAIMSRKLEVEIDARSKEALASTVKRIVGCMREGKVREGYEAYAALFEDEGFTNQRPQDQRSVLKLMVLAKNKPPGDFVARAHRNALTRLKALVKWTDDPLEHEMIAVCEQVLADQAHR